jgi:drug/metabolite transporter (DMT)-like permease
MRFSVCIIQLKFVAQTSFGKRWNLLKFETITLHYFVKFVVPTGILLCSTIVFNNTSLDHVDVATNSIIKSLNPLLVAVFSFLVLKKVHTNEKLHFFNPSEERNKSF